MAMIATAILTFSVYSPSIFYDFINVDDPGMLTKNEYIKNITLFNIWNIFTDSQIGNWVPLTYLTFMLEYRFFGLDPRIYHAINVLLHALNSVLVFLFVLSFINILRERKIVFSVFLENMNSRIIFSFYVALVFGLHPQRVESVAWVIERKDVLFGIFYLLGLIIYLKYIKHAHNIEESNAYVKNRLWWWTLILFVLSGLSKAMAVSFPCVLLLLDWLMGRKLSLQLFREKIPYFLVAFWITIMASAAGYQGLTMVPVSFEVRIVNATAAYGTYIEKFLWPLNLSPMYYYEAHNIQAFIFVTITALATTVLLGILYLFSNKLVKASILIFLVTLLPVIGITQIGSQEIADRFTYIPSIVLSIWFAAGVFYFAQSTIFRNRFLKFLLLSTPILFYTVITCLYLPVWKNSEAYWLRVIQERPKFKAYEVLTTIYFKEGNYANCIALNFHAHKAYPNNPVPLFNIALISYKMGETELLKGTLAKLLESYPLYGETYLLISQINHDPKIKREYLRKALTLNPELALKNRGYFLSERDFSPSD